MALKEKRSGRTESVPIQDFAHNLIEPLPESIQRFPGMKEWESRLRSNFDALAKRLWQKKTDETNET
jgi:hypothetical protein